MFLFDKVKILLRQYFVSFPGVPFGLLQPSEAVFLPLREWVDEPGTEPCCTARLGPL